MDEDNGDWQNSEYSKHAIYAAESDALFGGGEDEDVSDDGDFNAAEKSAEAADELSRQKREERERQERADADLAEDLFGGGITIDRSELKESVSGSDAKTSEPGVLDSAPLNDKGDFEAFGDLVAKRILEASQKSHNLQLVLSKILSKFGSHIANNDLGILSRDLELLQRQKKREEQAARQAAKSPVVAQQAVDGGVGGKKKKRNRNRKNKPKPANDLLDGMVEDEFDFM